MDKQRILVVDDERDLCDILLYNLTAAGYEAVAAGSAEEALDLINSKERYDLLLLDVMMPGLSGFELARRLKADDKTAHYPIIFLTAKDAEDDKLQGFDLSADDYIAKPFSVRELLARVKAVLGRFSPTPTLIQYEGLIIHLDQKTVEADGEHVTLTKTEFEILRLLLTHRTQVFSRKDILDKVWPKDVIVTERMVDVNIARLRKKIGRYAACIVNRQGYGYLFEVKSEE